MILVKVFANTTMLFLFILFLQGCSDQKEQGGEPNELTQQSAVPVNKKMKTCEAVCSSASLVSLKRAGNSHAINASQCEYENSTGSCENSETKGMVWIPGGKFEMGTDDPDFPDASPKHQVEVNGFWMDAHEVTNAEFEEFVKKTGYKTISERPLDPKDFPGVPAEQLVPGSAVFTPPPMKVPHNDILQWWKYEPGAYWKKPFGAQNPGNALPDHPVVQISYEDALAYCSWAGKRLPTEAEWEFAAQAGQGNKKFYWGNELKPKGKWAANIFQGKFPEGNTAEDGYMGVGPVGSFPANAYGLYDMEGNVWEWCNDYYRPDYYAKCPVQNPTGPSSSFDPEEPQAVKRVQRGGSFLCSDEYCIRYKSGARGKGDIWSASNNLGFRCVKDAKAAK